MDATAFHDAIAAVCPVVGVSIGNPADKTTWRVDYAPAATDAQKSAVAAVVASFDPNAATAKQVLPQDLMAQFTTADAAAIQAAIANNVQFWLLWSALQAQRDPMVVTNARFRAGWAALIQVLGQARMAQIAAALNLTIG